MYNSYGINCIENMDATLYCKPRNVNSRPRTFSYAEDHFCFSMNENAFVLFQSKQPSRITSLQDVVIFELKSNRVDTELFSLDPFGICPHGLR